MKVKQINLDNDAMPTTLVVEMSRREAVLIAIMTGKNSPSDVNEILPGYGDVNNDVYYCLTGEVFNRFWDDWVDEAR